MTKIDCTTCHNEMPTLLFDEQAPSPPLTAHLAACAACATELQQLRATMALMDSWTAPEPSDFFDARVRAAVHREQKTPVPASLLGKLAGFLGLGASRGLRPAMAGALGLAMLLGGGTAVTLLTHHSHPATTASPTVDDLKIYDNNAQALEQMDMLDDSGSTSAQPQS